MEQESLAQGVARREQEHRSARIARVDETARAIYCAGIKRVQTGPLLFDMEFCISSKRAYQAALSLERARDEAIEDLDSIPPRGEK